MTHEDRYHQLHPRSAQLYERALEHFPSGVTHDGRWMQPFPIAIAQASGAYKWDVDGNQLIDYWQGHGALLLGHGPAPVVAAVQRQVERGTHYGANHELEIEWAIAVKSCFPQLERLRFTSSGTEATLLALRLARAYTRKPTVLRFAGHFHGWHDLLAQDVPNKLLPGVLRQVSEGLLVLPAALDVLERTLATRDDIAAVVLEPSGATFGTQPLPDTFLQQVRVLTHQRNVLLICDEVVTGFRVAPGGVQQRADVVADLTALAKVVAGGLPGGAVGGRADIFQHLAFGDTAWNAEHKISHMGTYNANPLAAAAGIAALAIVRSGEPQRRAAQLGTQLIEGLNAVLRRRNLRGSAAYGDGSIFHLILGSDSAFAPGALPPELPLAELKQGGDSRLLAGFRLAMLNHGVDLLRGKSGFVSAAHTEADIETTIAAFDAALGELAEPVT